MKGDKENVDGKGVLEISPSSRECGVTLLYKALTGGSAMGTKGKAKDKGRE